MKTLRLNSYILSAGLALGSLGAVGCGELEVSDPGPSIVISESSYQELELLALAEVPVDSLRRAQDFLDAMRNSEMAPEFTASSILDELVVPMYRPDIEEVAYYEFGISTGGYILVSANDHDNPVPTWNSNGERLTDKTLLALGEDVHDAAKIYRLDAITFVAEDSSGELLSDFQPRIPVVEGDDSIVYSEESIVDEDGVVRTIRVASNVDENGNEVELSRVDLSEDIPSPEFEMREIDWQELKSSYAEIFASQIEQKRLDVQAEWSNRVETRGIGQALMLGEAKVFSLLGEVASVDHPAGVQVELVDTESGQEKLTVSIIDEDDKSTDSFDVLVSYVDGRTETLSLKKGDYLASEQDKSWVSAPPGENQGVWMVDGAYQLQNINYSQFVRY